MTMTLETTLEQAYDELAINQDQRKSLHTYLEVIRKRDEATYHHCIRTGLLGKDIAKYLGLEQKALFYAGLLHDLGKVLVDGDLLRKRTPFTEEDYRRIRDHPVDGHNMLSGIHEHTAQIIVRHHRYQHNPYPADSELPQPKVRYTGEVMEKIERYARLLSIADFYDAVTTRDNAKFEGKLDPVKDVDRIKRIFKKMKPDDYPVIEDLITKGVLNGKYI